MLMTYEKKKNIEALQDVINRIRQYNPEDNFVEFIKYLKNNSILTYILNNDSSAKKDVIFKLDEAASKRISFLIGDDDKILEQGKKYRELLREDKITVSENINNYDIIYRDKKLMYFNESSKDDKLIYTYYDIKTYKEIESIIFGG